MLEGIIVRRPAGTISIFCQEFLIKRVSLLNIDAASSPTFKNFDIGTKFPLESGLRERRNFKKSTSTLTLNLKRISKNFDIGTRVRLESELQERKKFKKINLNFNFQN